MKLITFTVPCYNSAAYMHRCIDSLLRAGQAAEILIINDGSTDDTGAIADGYAKEYPDIVRVHHQENGGHGAGINAGLALATGKYFKVVDSDDWLAPEGLARLLSVLSGDVSPDMIITNYCYWRPEEGVTNTIRYGNVFPEGRQVSWEDTRHFGVTQYLTIHSSVFATETLRRAGVNLPKHLFYEDNLFIHQALPFCDRLLYLDCDLYMYYVGRDGQSVSEENLIRRADQQATVSAMLFEASDITRQMEICPKRGQYLYHAASFFLAIGTVFLRMRKTEEAEELVRQMWNRVYKADEKMGRRIHNATIAMLTDLPGDIGRFLCVNGYRVAHKVVKFN